MKRETLLLLLSGLCLIVFGLNQVFNWYTISNPKILGLVLIVFNLAVFVLLIRRLNASKK